MATSKKPATKRAAAKRRPTAKAAPKRAAAKQAATKRPAAKVATKRSVKQAATTKKAATKRPATKQAATKRPAAKQAATKRPAAKKAAAKRPAAKQTATKRTPSRASGAGTAARARSTASRSKARTSRKRDEQEKIESRVVRVDDHLTQHIVVVRTLSRTFPTSNVWVLQDGGEAALIDAGYGDEQSMGERRKFLGKELGHLNFKTIAITHHHFDHSSGGRQLRDLLHADTAINPLDEVLLHADNENWSNEDLPDEEDITERARTWREEALNTPIDRTLADGETFRVGGLTVRAVHTPGHTAGHNCYFVEETMQLFTGDNVLGVGTSAIGPPPSGDMQAYLDSLVRMRALQSTLFAPGHGPVVTATDAKIQELLDHRATRDRQILDLIDRGYDTDQRIRRALYPELQKSLRRAAGGQVRSHLARFVGQGVVTVEEIDGGKTWQVALTK